MGFPHTYAQIFFKNIFFRHNFRNVTTSIHSCVAQIAQSDNYVDTALTDVRRCFGRQHRTFCVLDSNFFANLHETSKQF